MRLVGWTGPAPDGPPQSDGELPKNERQGGTTWQEATAVASSSFYKTHTHVLFRLKRDRRNITQAPQR
jgi:hypothetical protein